MMTVVEWADRGGGGLSLQRGTTAVRREFRAVASGLMDRGVGQPSGAIGPTFPHPVWSLRHLRVDRLGGFWCFAVQGRHGPFGAAGTCRFGFLPDQVPPGDVWRLGNERLAASEQEPLPEADPAALEEAVAGVLAGLTFGLTTIRAGRDPALAAQVIGRVLAGLPAGIVQRWVWMTCPLGALPNPRRGQGAVAGLPPESFGRPTAIQRAALALRQVGPPDRRELTTKLGEEGFHALEALGRRMCQGPRADRYQQVEAREMVTLLDEVSAQERAISWRDLPGLLSHRDPAERERILEYPHLVVQWATEQPKEVMDWLRKPGSALVALLARLFPAGAAGAAGGMPAGQASAAGGDELLEALFPEGATCDPDRDLEWLKELRVDVTTHPARFPPAFQWAGRIMAGSFAAMARGPWQVDEAAALLAEIDRYQVSGRLERGWLEPSAAAAFLAARFAPKACGQAPEALGELRRWTAVLAAAPSGAHGRDAVRWVEGLLKDLRKNPTWQEPSIRAVMYGAFEVLIERREYFESDIRLQRQCAAIGVDDQAPQGLRDWITPVSAPEPPRQEPVAYQPEASGRGLDSRSRDPWPGSSHSELGGQHATTDVKCDGGSDPGYSDASRSTGRHSQPDKIHAGPPPSSGPRRIRDGGLGRWITDNRLPIGALAVTLVLMLAVGGISMAFLEQQGPDQPAPAASATAASAPSEQRFPTADPTSSVSEPATDSPGEIPEEFACPTPMPGAVLEVLLTVPVGGFSSDSTSSSRLRQQFVTELRSMKQQRSDLNDATIGQIIIAGYAAEQVSASEAVARGEALKTAISNRRAEVWRLPEGAPIEACARRADPGENPDGRYNLRVEVVFPES
ncbi:MAG: hypothetical protein JXA67_17945 [Micromonosporaceae bacterium]|nr:hypothetical protein [Micromonosporaceae bacterium]